MDQFQVGDLIVITKEQLKNEKGTILYIGELEGKTGTYYGISLENEKGTHNGAYLNKQYFQCEDKHGVFITGQHIKKPDEPAARKDKVPNKTMIVQPTKKADAPPKKAPKEAPKEKEVPKEVKEAPKVKKQPQPPSPTQTAQTREEESPEPIPQIQLPKAPSLVPLDSAEQIEALNREVTTYKQQISAMQVVTNDQRQQIAGLKRKVESLEQTIDENLEELESSEKMIIDLEMLKQQMDSKEKNLQQLQTENTFLKEEIQRLEEEKILADLELQETMLLGGTNLTTADSSELSKANQKLSQALQQVTNQLEQLTIQKNQEIQQLEERISHMPALQEKVKKFNQLEMQVRRLTEDNTELMTRLDESAELLTMVEKMSETLLKKDENMDALRVQIKENNEIKKLDQELIQQLEEMLAEQDKIIEDKQNAITQLNNNALISQQQIEDKEVIIARLKQKITQLNKQLDITKEEEATKDQPVEYSNKNQDIGLLLKETKWRALKNAIENVEIKSQTLKAVALFKAVPQEYSQKLRFTLIEPIVNVKRIGDKALLLADEFLLSDSAKDKLISEENQDLGFWMLEVHKQLIKLQRFCNIYCSTLQSAQNPEIIEKIGRNAILLNQFKIAESFIDHLTSLIQKDKLSANEPLINLQGIVNHLEEDIKIMQSDEGVELQDILQQLQFYHHYHLFNYKLIREQENVRTLQREKVQIDALIISTISKVKEQLRQLRHARSIWGSYSWLKQKEPLYDQLLSHATNVLNVVCGLKLEEYGIYFDNQKNEQYQSSIASLLHILTQINNSFEEQPISDEFTYNRQQTFTQHSWSPQSQWAQWVSTVRSQLQDVSFTIENERRLVNQLETLTQEKLLQYNELIGQKKAKEALESRVVELQLKADRVQGLENDKKRLQDKILQHEDATKVATKEFENLQYQLRDAHDREKLLEEQIRTVQKKTVEIVQVRQHSSRKLEEVVVNRNIEQVLLKENQLLRVKQMREDIMELKVNPIVRDPHILKLHQVKMDQLRSLAELKMPDTSQATRVYQQCQVQKKDWQLKDFLNTIQSIVVN